MDKIERKLWRKVTLYGFLLRVVPFVRMAAVSGGLSFGLANKGSDIDIFVITRPGRLYTARFFMNALLMMFGVRVFGENKASRFCLSFFVDEKNLDLSKVALNDSNGQIDDVYLAYWISKLKPVIDRRCLKNFEPDNQWVLKTLEANKLVIDRNKIVGIQILSFVFRKFFEFLLVSKFGAWFEKFAKEKQIKHLEKKFNGMGTIGAGVLGSDGVGAVVINDGTCKIHMPDLREAINKKYRKNKNAGFDEDSFISLLCSKKYL